MEAKSTKVGLELSQKKQDLKPLPIESTKSTKVELTLSEKSTMPIATITPKQDEKFKIVKLHWMRHAVSCANMLKIIGLAGLKGLLKDPSILLEGKIDPRSKYASDSKLSNLGIGKGEDLKRRLNIETNDIRRQLFGDDQMKIILTSNLRRAIETAIYSFGNLKNVTIIPVPYVGEQSSVASKIQGIEVDESNKPSTLNTLQTSINPLLIYMSGNNIDWTILEAENKRIKKDPISEVNSDKFNSEILPKILEKYTVKNIVIVSHTNFISHRSKLNKINNLEIITETIPYIKDNSGIILRSGTWNETILNKDYSFNLNNKDYVISNVLKKENYQSCEFPESIDKKVDIIKEKYSEYLKENPIKTGGFLEIF